MIKYSEYEQEAIKVALSAIEQALATNDTMQSTKEVENYLKIQLASQPDEWFVFLLVLLVVLVSLSFLIFYKYSRCRWLLLGRPA
jgi:hypothetical protein